MSGKKADTSQKQDGGGEGGREKRRSLKFGDATLIFQA